MFKDINEDTKRRLSLLLTLAYFTPYSSVSIVNFELVIADWEGTNSIQTTLDDTHYLILARQLDFNKTL